LQRGAGNVLVVGTELASCHHFGTWISGVVCRFMANMRYFDNLLNSSFVYSFFVFEQQAFHCLSDQYNCCITQIHSATTAPTEQVGSYGKASDPYSVNTNFGT
jgi:hypothetical protein